MLRKASRSGTEDDNADSGAETAESDCSKMSSTSSDFMATPVDEPLLMTLHLLANPGDSLMLQHTLDMLLKWVCPGLRLFNVSERACPLRDRARSRLSPVAGYPSLAVTLFLHESYGEERILRVLDFLQGPPWRYHHTESCRGRTGIHIASTTSPANGLLRPYLLPSRDFYSLGGGMPVWGVRPVHCGSETLRVTLYSGYDNFEDALRLYETILRRRAEEQKPGFCWFTLRAEDGLCLQLALKQLSPGVRVEPCDSAVLQFRVEEIGQLVPLLPNPCTPISATRWQTEDLDGNKILFQVKGHVPTRSTTSAFPLHDPLRAQSRGVAPAPLKTVSLCAQKPLLKDGGVFVSQRTLGSVRCGGGSEENGWSDSLCSSPLGSSCFSSQRSSPAALSVHPCEPCLATLSVHPCEPCLAASSVPEPSPSRVPLGVPETNVDTGMAVAPRPERPAVVGASGLKSLGRDLPRCLPDVDASVRAQGMAPACRTTTWDRDPKAPGTRQTCQAAGPSQSAVFWQSHTSPTPREPAVQDDEFFI